MRYLLILNDPPYGTKRSYTGLRLPNSLAQTEGAQVRVFLMGDAASCVLVKRLPTGTTTLRR